MGNFRKSYGIDHSLKGKGKMGYWKQTLTIYEWSHSVVSDSMWPHGLEPTRLVHPWNFQARVLEWVAISFSRGSSWPRDRTQVSHIAGRHFTLWTTWQVYSKDLTGFNHYTIQVILITHYSLKVASSKVVPAVEMVGWVYFQQKRGNKDPNCPGLPLTSKVILQTNQSFMLTPISSLSSHNFLLQLE